MDKQLVSLHNGLLLGNLKKKKNFESQNPQLMNLKKHNIEQRKPGKKNTHRMIPSI